MSRLQNWQMAELNAGFYVTSTWLRCGQGFEVQPSAAADRERPYCGDIPIPTLVHSSLSARALMLKPVPLSDYRRMGPKKLRIFRLHAKSWVTPIDINLGSLVEDSVWGLSDRLRFWHVLRAAVPPPGLTIRKLDLDDGALLRCRIEVDGEVLIESNNEEYARRFFRSVLREAPHRDYNPRDWTIKKSGWTRNKGRIDFFVGQIDGALGWGPKVPAEVESSLKEAFDGLRKRNWKSCVVMCRRALQALMETAYEKTFGAKPSSALDLNGLIRKFEPLIPPAIPRHWLNIADSIRNLGNVPGAHPRSIPGYRFSKRDAMLAYDNTAFVAAYFEKMS